MARFLGACAIVLVLIQPTGRVRAHPADMYAQNFAVSLDADAMHVEWQILPGPFLADAVWAAADLDQGGSISTSEAEAWIAPFVSSLSVHLDDKGLAHAGVQDVHWPASVDVMRTAEERIRFSLRFEWASDLSGAHTVEVHALHLEANSLNWFSVNAGAGLSFDRPAQDNGLLQADVHFGDPAPIDGAMTSWNTGTPNLPGFSAAVSQMAAGLTDSDQPEPP
ncbi:MAG: hypothetical protein V1755_12830, partial [Chloroflexota bacterium]